MKDIKNQEKSEIKPSQPQRPPANYDTRQAFRDAVYRTIYTRRDVRTEFTSQVIETDVLARILNAAHHAPSVGLSQPWNFLLIDELGVKLEVFKLFEQANAEASMLFDSDKQAHYKSLKLQGIVDSPLNICITCDRRSEAPVLGRTHQPQMDIYSTVCAVQNLWLAAKAEGVGVGWVSILDEQELGTLLSIPDNVRVVAYLCIGYVSKFHSTPDLIRKKWAQREALSSKVFQNHWEQTCSQAFTQALDGAELHRQTVIVDDV